MWDEFETIERDVEQEFRSQNNYPTKCGMNIGGFLDLENTKITSSQNNYPTKCGMNIKIAGLILYV